MGSGTLPPGAYVTLEHEFILIFRKGSKREFKNLTEKSDRQISSYFWEERNVWFSDAWEGVNGTNQKLAGGALRDRSAAYPFDLAYRLINMFSIKGDTVLDPCLGTGTTTLAAIASGRNSIGVELDPNFKRIILGRIKDSEEYCNNITMRRLTKHLEFVEERNKNKTLLKHKNKNYGFPVMTRQETNLLLNDIIRIREIKNDLVKVDYKETPQKEFCVKKTCKSSDAPEEKSIEEISLEATSESNQEEANFTEIVLLK